MTAIKLQWNTDTPVDKRFLIGVLAFGLGFAATGNRWLTTGTPIVKTIKKGDLLVTIPCAIRGSCWASA